MGGRVPGIGVGGFTTGGGLSYLSRERGFAGDNVYGYEVVLGNGSIVYASADENRDLWLALKGGSSNFGIVTRFDLAAFEQGLMLGGGGGALSGSTIREMRFRLMQTRLVNS
jgi:FAD/FMN-containing dehydrogenase